jgi:Colicin immunity protein / pyocin immunity protein
MKWMQKLTRQEMIDLVERLMLGDGSEEDAGKWLESLEASTSNPNVGDLIFYPAPGNENFSAEEIVDRACEYRPFEL